ncbi:porin [Pseudoduganella sp. R-43]|uniref:porin n=1 Tax=Pseudoduganella sp. R-43 TaxID=3404063 RepID=UPI003CE6753B
MRKVMLALAASASAGTAAAGTGVELYGVIDMALVHESGGQAALTKLTSGVESGSRFGLRGREDLGGGSAAVFVLESGFRADTGQAGQGGRLFGRQAYVGLESRLGTVTLGLQLTPQYLAMAAADPFDTGMAGDTENLMGFAGTMESSVKYASPRWHGVNVELAYASGDKSGQQRGGHAAGGAFSYTSGPLAVHVGHHRRSNPAAPPPEPDQEPASNTLLAAVYDFGVAKTHIAVGRDKGPDSTQMRDSANSFGYAVPPGPSHDSRSIMLGLSIPQGAGIWMASWLRKHDNTIGRQDATQLALGYRYYLSRRTDVYAAYGHMMNRNGAGYTVGNATGNGSGDRAFNLGLRHTF